MRQLALGMPKQIIWPILILLLLAGNAYTQTRLSGNLVAMEDKEPVVGAVVSLLAKTDSTILEYTISGAEGDIAFTVADDLAFLLQVQVLGFQDTLIDHATLRKLDSPFTLFLREEVSVLNEVQVTGSRFGVEAKGDSVIYDVELYRSQTDRTLSDLLAKLPGISVGEDGEIAYNGKRIDGILLEGKDVVTNLHELVGESVNADEVEGIEIITNYKAGSDKLSNLASNKVVMNVDMASAALGKWNVKGKAAAGYKNKGAADLSAFKIAEVLSASNFARYNSTGDEVVNVSDYLANQTSLFRALERAEDINQLLPTFFSLGADLQSNQDAVVNSNLLFTKPKHQLKAIVLATRLDRLSGNRFTNRYWLEEIVFTGENKTENKLGLLDITLNYKNLGNEKTMVELDMPVSSKRFDQNSIQKGDFAAEAVQTNSRNTLSETKATPALYLNHKLNDTWLLSLESSLNVHRLKNRQRLEDIQPILGTKSLEVEQTLIQNKEEYFLQLGTEYSRNEHTAALSLQKRVSNQDNQSESDQAAFRWSQPLRRAENGVAFTYQYDKGKIGATVKSLIASITTEAVALPSFTSIFARSTVELAYKFSPLYSIGIGAGIAEKPAPLSLLIDEKTITGPNELTLSKIDASTKSLYRNLSATYFNFSGRKGLRILSQINYAESFNTPVAQYRTENDFALRQWEINQSDRAWESTNMFDFPLLANAFLFKNQINLSIGRNTLDENTFVGSKALRSFHNLHSNFTGNFNFELGFTYQLQSNETDMQDLELQDLQQMRYKGIVKYDIEKLHAEVYTQYSENRFGDTSSLGFVDVGGELAYEVRENLSLQLEASDLLNLNGAESLSAYYHPTFISQIEFRRFPGFVLAGLSWSF